MPPASSIPSHAPRAATRRLTQMAILTALAVLIRRFLTPQVIGLNLGGFPLILSGLMLGPAGGATVGALSDLIGASVAPRGELDPVYTLTAALTGAIPALLLRLRPSQGQPSLGALMGAILAGQLVTKSLIIPVYKQLLTGIPWYLTATAGLVVALVHVPLYALLARNILRALPPR